MMRLVLAIFLLCVALIAHSAAAAEVVDASVCDVLTNPLSFNGKTIRLKNATVVAAFDEFVVEGSGCSAGGAIWLAYPEGTKANAGPAAFVRLQLAKNSTAVPEPESSRPVALQRNEDFERFDSLLAKPYKTSAACLACPRHKVTASLVGRLDGASSAGIVRDATGAVTGIGGFGNMNMYRARLVLQSVSDVASRDIDYSLPTTAVNGDARRVRNRTTADQVRRAGAAFGAPGEANGVMVGFGIANEAPANERARGTEASPDGVLFLVTLDMKRLGKELLSSAIAHVGTHIADVRDERAQTLEAAESRAWQVTFSR